MSLIFCKYNFTMKKIFELFVLTCEKSVFFNKFFSTICNSGQWLWLTIKTISWTEIKNKITSTDRNLPTIKKQVVDTKIDHVFNETNKNKLEGNKTNQQWFDVKVSLFLKSVNVLFT